MNTAVPYPGRAAFMDPGFRRDDDLAATRFWSDVLLYHLSYGPTDVGPGGTRTRDLVSTVM